MILVEFANEWVNLFERNGFCWRVLQVALNEAVGRGAVLKGKGTRLLKRSLTVFLGESKQTLHAPDTWCGSIVVEDLLTEQAN